MKSKFSSILKIHKDKVTKIEKEMFQINSNISNKNNEIIQLKSEISKANFIPKSNEYSEFLTFQGFVDAMRNEIDELNIEIDRLNMKKSILEQQYKAAKVEFEKIEFLYTKELEILRARLNKEEQNLLDDYGGILYHNRNRRL